MLPMPMPVSNPEPTQSWSVMTDRMYAASVAARTLTMAQVGPLAFVTEFVGAVALGDRVTSTIKNGIIDIGRFTESPGALMLAMGCAGKTDNTVFEVLG